VLSQNYGAIYKKKECFIHNQYMYCLIWKLGEIFTEFTFSEIWSLTWMRKLNAYILVLLLPVCSLTSAISAFLFMMLLPNTKPNKSCSGKNSVICLLHGNFKNVRGRGGQVLSLVVDRSWVKIVKILNQKFESQLNVINPCSVLW